MVFINRRCTGADACTQALHAQMQAHLHEGEARPKFRPAKNSDRLLVSREVMVPLPPVDTFPEGITIRMLWQISGDDIWFELKRDNIEYAISALKISAPAEPKEKKPVGSPKKRRRLRRKLSQPPASVPGEEAEQAEPAEPAEPAEQAEHAEEDAEASAESLS